MYLYIVNALFVYLLTLEHFFQDAVFITDQVKGRRQVI